MIRPRNAKSQPRKAGVKRLPYGLPKATHRAESKGTAKMNIETPVRASHNVGIFQRQSKFGIMCFQPTNMAASVVMPIYIISAR